MQDELALTSTHCCGMNLKMQMLTHQQSHCQCCSKPILYLRISLGTSRGRIHPCSTVTDQSCSSLKQNGSACSAGMQLISTMSSQISTVSHNSNNVIELRKSVKLLHRLSTPAKTVKTHRDWVITWDCLVDAMLFMFRHRRSELQLQSYGKHIQRFFASLPSQFYGKMTTVR
jgi:hypothetical protein